MIRASKNSAKKRNREPARFRSAVDSNGRTIWIADAHRDDGKRFVVRAEEKLTAFLELEAAIRTYGELCPYGLSESSHARARGNQAPKTPVPNVALGTRAK
jgi:hypothetical protein